MNNINIENIVDKIFQNKLDGFIETLEGILKENPDISSEQYFSKIIPETVHYNKDLIKDILKEYHQQLITFLTSSNHQQ